MRGFTRPLLVAVSLLFVRTASGDTLVFKDGRQMDGVVTVSGDKVELRVAEGTFFFKRDLVAHIRQSVTPLQEYERRRAALKAGDAHGHWQLGQFCEANGLKAQAAQEFRAVISAHPEHAEARERLGYRRVGHRWMTEDEQMQAKGMVRVGGTWMTKSDAADHAERQRDLARIRWEAQQSKARIEAASQEADKNVSDLRNKWAAEEAASARKKAEEQAREAARQREREGRYSRCRCGANVPEGDKFCPKCNQWVGW